MPGSVFSGLFNKDNQIDNAYADPGVDNEDNQVNNAYVAPGVDEDRYVLYFDGGARSLISRTLDFTYVPNVLHD